MVNIAFPYKEIDASAMDLALRVLQSMAEKGNKYIRACHSLLTKIRTNIKPRSNLDNAAPPGVAVAEAQCSGASLQQLHQDALSQSSTAVDASIGNGHGASAIDLGVEGDQRLWEEILDSISLNMDRQWIEQQLETDSHV